MTGATSLFTGLYKTRHIYYEDGKEALIITGPSASQPACECQEMHLLSLQTPNFVLIAVSYSQSLGRGGLSQLLCEKEGTKSKNTEDSQPFPAHAF